jgi:hypothetical protein
MPKKYSDKQEAEYSCISLHWSSRRKKKRWTINLIAETLKGKEGLSFKLRNC